MAPTVHPELEIYDTTLRDGAQQEGISLTVSDKLRIASLLDSLGVHFIEGGWPGALPKDDEFFARAKTELSLSNSQLTAFGSTRRPSRKVESDPQIRALLEAETEVICIVGKSWDYHVREALRTDLDEGIRMAAESGGVSEVTPQTGVLRRRALFRRLSHQPPLRPGGVAGGMGGGRRAAGAVRHQRWGPSRRDQQDHR